MPVEGLLGVEDALPVLTEHVPHRTDTVSFSERYTDTEIDPWWQLVLFAAEREPERFPAGLSGESVEVETHDEDTPFS